MKPTKRSNVKSPSRRRFQRLVKLILAGKASIHEAVALEQTEFRFSPRRRIE